MRKATNIERILCDMKDLVQSVANGNERIGLMTFEQGEHDGHVDAIVWDVIQDESGVVRRVRHGYEISAGDMVLLFDHLANLAKRS
jgi:hypothetical protein